MKCDEFRSIIILQYNVYIIYTIYIVYTIFFKYLILKCLKFLTRLRVTLFCCTFLVSFGKINYWYGNWNCFLKTIILIFKLRYQIANATTIFSIKKYKKTYHFIISIKSIIKLAVSKVDLLKK